MADLTGKSTEDYKSQARSDLRVRSTGPETPPSLGWRRGRTSCRTSQTAGRRRSMTGAGHLRSPCLMHSRRLPSERLRLPPLSRWTWPRACRTRVDDWQADHRDARGAIRRQEAHPSPDPGAKFRALLAVRAAFAAVQQLGSRMARLAFRHARHPRPTLTDLTVTEDRGADEGEHDRRPDRSTSETPSPAPVTLTDSRARRGPVRRRRRARGESSPRPQARNRTGSARITSLLRHLGRAWPWGCSSRRREIRRSAASEGPGPYRRRRD